MTDKYAKLREAADHPGAQHFAERLLNEADAMDAAVNGDDFGETFHRQNWEDKPHRVLFDATKLIREAASHLAAEKARADAAEAERDELLAWSKTITNTLSDAIRRGSEMFRRHGEQYRVDPDFVATYIRDRRQSFHEAMLKNAEDRNRDRATISTLTAERDALIRERDEARDTIATASAIVAKHAWRSPELDNLFERLAAALSDANAAEREVNT